VTTTTSCKKNLISYFLRYTLAFKTSFFQFESGLNKPNLPLDRSLN